MGTTKHKEPHQTQHHLAIFQIEKCRAGKPIGLKVSLSASSMRQIGIHEEDFSVTSPGDYKKLLDATWPGARTS